MLIWSQIKKIRRIFLQPEFPALALQTPGFESEDVLRFQKLLNLRGARYEISVEETGIYDDQTCAAVSRYQLRSLNIVNSDGLVGPQTARKLKITLIDDKVEA